MSRASQARYNERERSAARALGMSIRQYRRAGRGAGTIAVRPRRSAVPLRVQRAAVNLRTTGVPKEGVYRAFRRVLKNPPSRRELDAVYRRYGSRYLGGVRGKRNRYFRSRSPKGRSELSTEPSTYRTRRAAELRYLGDTRDLDRSFAIAYLRAGYAGASDAEIEALFEARAAEWMLGESEGY